MFSYSKIKKIKIQGHRNTRTLTCPYCRSNHRVTLVNHLRRSHPIEWDEWTDEFFNLYSKTNDLKKVMASFTNSEGTPILSWSVIDNEIKRTSAKKGKAPKFLPKKAVNKWNPSSDEYQMFTTTLWDIPSRGNWSVHQSTYRGNSAPHIPRAIMETYSRAGDVILDPFVGGGTTLIEAWSLGRNAIGYDISDTAISLTTSRLTELAKKADSESLYGLPNVQIDIRKGDARKLPNIENESIDLICTHPPYWDALRYTHDSPGDLSLIASAKHFMDELESAGSRFHEVLKPGSVCAILIGDVRRDGKLYALGFETVSRFRNIGFDLEELIIKTQNRERSKEFYLKESTVRFRLAHEYLIILRKPRIVSEEKNTNVVRGKFNVG